MSATLKTDCQRSINVVIATANFEPGLSQLVVCVDWSAIVNISDSSSLSTNSEESVSIWHEAVVVFDSMLISCKTINEY